MFLILVNLLMRMSEQELKVSLAVERRVELTVERRRRTLDAFRSECRIAIDMLCKRYTMSLK